MEIYQKRIVLVKDCIFKTKFERLFQTLFYEVFSLEELFSKTLISISFMQANHLARHIKHYSKITFCFENMLVTGLKHCSDYLKTLGIGLN
jgi:hypothetical protein